MLTDPLHFIAWVFLEEYLCRPPHPLPFLTRCFGSGSVVSVPLVQIFSAGVGMDPGASIILALTPGLVSLLVWAFNDTRVEDFEIKVMTEVERLEKQRWEENKVFFEEASNRFSVKKPEIVYIETWKSTTTTKRPLPIIGGLMNLAFRK